MRLKVKPWVYVVIFLVLFIVSNLILPELFLGLKAKSDDDYSLVSYISLIFSFISSFVLYNLIEKGKVNLSDILRIIIGIILLSLSGGLIFIPFGILGAFGGSLVKNLWQVIAFYAGAIALVIVLASILAWINDTSPRYEIKKSIDIF